MRTQQATRTYFNSHPHKEDDKDEATKPEQVSISTHILTRRMTVYIAGKEVDGIISTHILTRRMTVSLKISSTATIHFNSHPHKEDDSNFKQKQSI